MADDDQNQDSGTENGEARCLEENRKLYHVEDGSLVESRIRGSKPAAMFGYRHLQVSLLFSGLACGYALRLDLSAAIVAMVRYNGTTEDSETYDWDIKAQSYVLSSFYWGYALTQLLAGKIAHIWGARRLLAAAMTAGAVLAILNPLAARIGGWKLLCATRMLEGMIHGVQFPCVHTLLSKWAPPQERGTLATFAYGGTLFGAVLSMSVSGALAASTARWPSIFYLFGGITVIWSLLWLYIGAESPKDHPRISPEEREYIEVSLSTDVVPKKLAPTPWKAILTSNPFLALLIANCCQLWGFSMLLSEIPTYLSRVHEFSMNKNGIVSALPYLGMWFLSFPMSIGADFLLKRGYVSVGTARKTCNTLGSWFPAAALVTLGYIDKDRVLLAVAILVIAVSFNSGYLCGYQVNHMDLSPNYAGILIGFANGVASISAIVSPLMVGVIVKDTTDITQWRTVFFISAAMYFVGNLYFVIFGSGEQQWWNDPRIGKNWATVRTLEMCDNMNMQVNPKNETQQSISKEQIS